MSDETQQEERPQRRELEQAPILLRKASLVLILGAILPWMTSISTMGNMPWGPWAIAVGLTLIGGFAMLDANKAAAGIKSTGLGSALAGANPMAGTIVGLVLFVVACGVAWSMGNSFFVGDEFMGFDRAAFELPDDVSPDDNFSVRALLELGTLFLGLATFAHILAYEYYGTKFNPLFPLMFLGPAVAGSLHVFTALTSDATGPSKLIGIVGSLVVAAGGIMAMYTMYVSMRQAKVEGDLKKAAERERRKAERASRRSS
ncbi:MAG: hypothetical protein AAGG01_00450 [Planctomycetota bacterium]